MSGSRLPGPLDLLSSGGFDEGTLSRTQSPFYSPIGGPMGELILIEQAVNGVIDTVTESVSDALKVKEIAAWLEKCGAAKERLLLYAAAIATGKWGAVTGDKPLIECVCASAPDATVLEIARYATMETGGLASKHLDHYLSGSGKDYEEDLNDVLTRDEGVRGRVIESVKAAGARVTTPPKWKGLKGTVPIRQRDYKVKEFQLAFGSLGSFQWEIDESSAAKAENRSTPGTCKVICSFRDLYRWHPNADRVTQCVHRAAENLKKAGAKDYYMVAKPLSFRFQFADDMKDLIPLP